MAVRISTKPNLCDDEDEKPLVFKRSNAKSKQNQLDGQLKQLPVQNKSTTIKEESNSIEHPAEENSDSEDAKPIKARLGKPCEDSDDDKPLSSRITPKKVGTSGSQPYDSKERKPVASKVQKNCSSTTDKGKTSYVISTKRPLDKANISEKSSAKRPKVSDSSTSIKNMQVSAKKEPKGEDDDDFIPISQRIKKATSDNKSPVTKQKLTKVGPSSIKKKIKKGQKASQFSKYSKSTTVPPSSNDGQKKWTSLVHNGVIFPPPYKPHGVKMLYSGKPVTLSPEQEEVATMYAVMKDTDYVQKQTFRNNFWNDWHKLLGKNHIIQKLDACDFTPIYDWYQNEKEKKKQMSTEEKKALKEDKLKEEEKYMWAVVDGVKEKDDDEADTVGCCTLKVENVKAIAPNSLEFNFLGKDSIRYENTVEVEIPVYKAIIQFQTGKRGCDDLFDRLDTSKLNAHLKELMPGLTAKVFRTYNASITLDNILNKETKEGDLSEKVVVYQHANKEVAIICNHQRTISKTHSAQMSRLLEKIGNLQSILKELKTDLDRAKKGRPPLKDADGKQKRNLTPEALEKKIAQTTVKIEKMELDMRTKEDLKTVALGTSKINYLDPRITVAWCKRHEVPIEKIFNKSLLAKFAWAMDVDPDFRF
ncbi:DNA topoisomerase 1 alpha-like isoform X2 [Prunus dulcis]|uniref:DNA topoisomerase 1 alpha-like isoform X2 n=1 Tax=Prunus dulcis TaxID=3755 RepID=UPI001481E585|nr:DNA topoisomerase 1 alpha-like isoform X2 [Prunus dulcis]